MLKLTFDSIKFCDFIKIFLTKLREKKKITYEIYNEIRGMTRKQPLKVIKTLLAKSIITPLIFLTNEN